MAKDYEYKLLKTILNLKVGREYVWKKRIQQQTQYVHLLEEVFGTEITRESFGFYPGNMYMSTPLTTDPAYTETMKPVWTKMVKALTKKHWDVYAPFTLTDPHAKIPDSLSSYQIRDLDHIKVLNAEVALFDLNRPSHGVGQEVEMSIFLPKIAYSQVKVSRMVKGMPGLLLLNYKTTDELLDMLSTIFKRVDYQAEPFYLAKCPYQPTHSVFKGATCLNCQFASHLHAI